MIIFPLNTHNISTLSFPLIRLYSPSRLDIFGSLNSESPSYNVTLPKTLPPDRTTSSSDSFQYQEHFEYLLPPIFYSRSTFINLTFFTSSFHLFAFFCLFSVCAMPFISFSRKKIDPNFGIHLSYSERKKSCGMKQFCLSLNSCAILGKLFKLSEPQFSHLYMGDDTTYQAGCFSN